MASVELHNVDNGPIDHYLVYFYDIVFVQFLTS